MPHYREIGLENQKKMGIVPPDTELSPINPYLDVKGPNGEPWPVQDTVRPWDSLSDEEKKLFARMAEVFAGFLSYTDAQIGRILDYLEESGHARARAIRKLVNRWLAAVRGNWNEDFLKKRRWVLWESVAAWHCYYRRHVMYAMGWKPPRVRAADLRKLYLVNEPLCRALFGESRTERESILRDE